MKTDNLSTLKIHKLTQAQYDREREAGNLDENAIYLTPEEDIDLSPYATVEQLNDKADVNHTHDDKYYTEEEIDNKVGLLESNKVDKTNAVMYESVSMGRIEDSTVGENSVALGSDVISSGKSSYAEGLETKSLNQGSHAEGYNTEVSGLYGHAEGNSTTATAHATHAEGQLSTASASCAHAEGWKNTASGSHSHAEGEQGTAEGRSSHTEGQSTIAKGLASHAEGIYSQAIGQGSHAEGYSTTSTGNHCHAEGVSTKAEGQGSHAEGHVTNAEGEYAHAEGNCTYATGESSHAEGYRTQADGQVSHAEGYNTTATSHSQHVQGRYNIIDVVDNFTDYGKYAHIVGNGISYKERSNAHTLDWNGNAWYQGDVYVGGSSQDEGQKLAKESSIHELNKQLTFLNKESGKTIVTTDSANMQFVNIKTIGKSWQDKIPTVDTQQDVHSHGESGSIVQFLFARNLIDWCGNLKTEINGLTTSIQSDGGINVVGTNTVGYSQIVRTTKTLPAGTYFVSGGECVPNNVYTQVSFKNVETGKNVYNINQSFTLTQSTTITVSILTHGTTGEFIDTIIYPMLSVGTEQIEFSPYVEEQNLTLQTTNGLGGIQLGQTIPNEIKNSPIHMSGVYWDEVEQQYYIGDTKNENGKDIQRVWKGSPTKTIVFSDRNDSGICSVFDYNIFGVEFLNAQIPSMSSIGLYSVCCDGDDGTFSLSANGLYYKDSTKTIDEVNAIFAELGTDIEFCGVLAEPIVTDITEEEISQYNALRMNYPNTTVINDAGAYTEIEYVTDTKTHNYANTLYATKKNTVITDSISMGRVSDSTVGENSIALGSDVISSGKSSYAEGLGTISLCDTQHVQGRYNIKDTNNKYAHIVGGGTADNYRRNIHTLDWNGNAWYEKSVSVGDAKMEYQVDNTGRKMIVFSFN